MTSGKVSNIFCFREISKNGSKKLVMKLLQVMFSLPLRLIKLQQILRCKKKDMLQLYCIQREPRILNWVKLQLFLQRMREMQLHSQTTLWNQQSLLHQLQQLHLKSKKQQHQLLHLLLQLQLLHKQQPLEVEVGFLLAHQQRDWPTKKESLQIKSKEQDQIIESLKQMLMKQMSLLQKLKLLLQLLQHQHQQRQLQNNQCKIFHKQSLKILRTLKLEKLSLIDLPTQNRTSHITM